MSRRLLVPLVIAVAVIAIVVFVRYAGPGADRAKLADRSGR